MKVLLFTNKEDVTTDFIVQELKRQEIEFYRFNTEELSKSVEIVLDFERERYLLIDKLDKKEYDKASAIQLAIKDRVERLTELYNTYKKNLL